MQAGFDKIRKALINGSFCPNRAARNAKPNNSGNLIYAMHATFYIPNKKTQSEHVRNSLWRSLYMSKILCIIHANCQGAELESLLLRSRNFSNTFRVERYTNYTRESIPEESLAECELFLYQHIGPQWGELCSVNLLAKLSKLTPSLQIPNMLFTACWPSWVTRGPMNEWNDKFLNQRIAEGLPREKIISLYMSPQAFDPMELDACLERGIAIERVKEQNSYVKTVDFIMERWKRKPMFHTINHPCKELLIHSVQGILEGIGMPLLTRDELLAALADNAFPSYAGFDLPVHPRVASYHGLSFITPGHRFAVFGQKMTFEQYIGHYIDCRREGREKDFPAYLQEEELLTGTCI